MSDVKQSLEEGFKNDLLFGMSAYQLDDDGFHVLPIEETLKLTDVENTSDSSTLQPNFEEFKETLSMTPRKFWQELEDSLALRASGKTVLIQSPSQDMLNRIESLEQRVQRQAELLEQMERALDELTGVLRPSLDLTNPIHQLHQQIIDEHPLEYGQRFQAIDRDGTVWRFSSEPYIGMSTSEWWNNGCAVWCITDDVQLNGINWKDTLVKL